VIISCAALLQDFIDKERHRLYYRFPNISPYASLCAIPPDFPSRLVFFPYFEAMEEGSSHDGGHIQIASEEETILGQRFTYFGMAVPAIQSGEESLLNPSVHHNAKALTNEKFASI
jgi:hypothetical protein